MIERLKTPLGIAGFSLAAGIGTCVVIESVEDNRVVDVAAPLALGVSSIGIVLGVAFDLRGRFKKSDQQKEEETKAQIPMLTGQYNTEYLLTGPEDWTVGKFNRAMSKLKVTKQGLNRGGTDNLLFGVELDVMSMSSRLGSYRYIEGSQPSDYTSEKIEEIKTACELLDLALPIDIDADPEGPKTWFEFVEAKSNQERIFSSVEM